MSLWDNELAPLRRGFFVAGRVAGPSLGIGCRFGSAWRAGPATIGPGPGAEATGADGGRIIFVGRVSSEIGLHVPPDALVG